MEKKYEIAVKEIKEAILRSQYEAIKSINEKQLRLYYAIGKYLSQKTKLEKWGTNALKTISDQLLREIPGLRGFSYRNFRYMKKFYEEWTCLEQKFNSNYLILKNEISITKDRKVILQSQMQKFDDHFYEAFVSIGFTHHIVIMDSVEDIDERVFYIKLCYKNILSVSALKKLLDEGKYIARKTTLNNFANTLKDLNSVTKAITTFKDNYSLNFINTEEIDVRDKEDIDERVLENRIVHNIKKFILTFGEDFAFMGNQYHLDAFGEDEYIDLLFYHRELKCLVAIELKTGKFKPAYLGQLSGYLDILDGFVKKKDENPSIGILLCKDINKSHVDYVLNGYNHPISVATYKTTLNMPEELKKSLPSVEELIEILDGDDDED